MPSEFRAETNLFGIRIALTSYDGEALRVARTIFAGWECGEQSTETVRIVLHARKAGLKLRDHAQIIGPHLRIVQNGIALRANGRCRVGCCVFPAADVNGEAFHEALHTVGLFLVAHAGRTPVHAAAIVIRNTAVVLAGKSGSGKSSLAMAAHRKNLPVLSEDSVFVQLEPSFGVWGMADAIHLLEENAASEGHVGKLRIRHGRAKRVFPIGRPPRRSEKACLCVITGGDAIGLEKIPPEEAVTVLTRTPEPGFGYYGSQSARAIRAVAAGGCWRLTLSDDPDAAIAAVIDRLTEHCV